jgi:hypothetical protein
MKKKNMDTPTEIRRLRRHVWITYFASSLIAGFGIIAICLFFNPAFVGVRPEQVETYQGVWVWLVVGIMFTLFSLFGILYLGRWIRRALWLLQKVPPKRMMVSIKTVQGSDSTEYYAYLREETVEQPAWKVTLTPDPSPRGRGSFHSFRGQKYPEQEIVARVYLDPKTKKPAVIESEYGLFWAFGKSSVVKVSAFE